MILGAKEKIDLNKKNLIIDKAVLEEKDFYNNKNIESLTIIKFFLFTPPWWSCRSLRGRR